MTTRATKQLLERDPLSTSTPLSDLDRQRRGPQVHGRAGIVYRGNTQFSIGGAYTTTAAIAGTTDDRLYQSERYGDFFIRHPGSEWRLSGDTQVCRNLLYAAGKRVFNVLLEGVKVISNLDVVAKVGLDAAYDVVLPVHVADGKLNIAFKSVVDNATVSAIMVQAKGSTP